SLEVDPEQLSQAEERLAWIRRLMRKHAMDGPGLRAKRTALTEELAGLSNREEARGQLEAERAQVLEEATEAARALSAARERSSAVLGRAVTQSLRKLAMPSARFEVHVEACALGSDGVDEVCFLFSANAGEPLRPLARVASGGEASRLLLALRRNLMASDDGIGCVLDEAGAGVSGAVAHV